MVVVMVYLKKMIDTSQTPLFTMAKESVEELV